MFRLGVKARRESGGGGFLIGPNPKLGRIEFDRSEALRQAMETFWDLGYEGASTAVLVDRLGIARSSLYAAFGSKDGLSPK